MGVHGYVIVAIVLYCVGLCVVDGKGLALRQKHSNNNNIDDTLHIGAFNIQVFGQSKIDEPKVVVILVEIISRYDLILIQEIRDIEETAIEELLDAVNEENSDDPFDMEISERLGRTDQKEQYAYFYRTSKLSVEDTYQYSDDNDDFERPPFVVLFQTTDNELERFGYMGIHTTPDDAPTEIDKLVDVYDKVSKEWDLDDMVIGGDFNADCDYVRESEWDDIRLYTEERFVWLIPDEADTTVHSTDCAYDRLVLAGTNMKKQYVTGSAGVYNFEEDLKLSQDQALEVSDHYPVQMSVS